MGTSPFAVLTIIRGRWDPKLLETVIRWPRALEVLSLAIRSPARPTLSLKDVLELPLLHKHSLQCLRIEWGMDLPPNCLTFDARIFPKLELLKINSLLVSYLDPRVAALVLFGGSLEMLLLDGYPKDNMHWRTRDVGLEWMVRFGREVDKLPPHPLGKQRAIMLDRVKLWGYRVTMYPGISLLKAGSLMLKLEELKREVSLKLTWKYEGPSEDVKYGEWRDGGHSGQGG